jgi:hypothetical protein
MYFAIVATPSAGTQTLLILAASMRRPHPPVNTHRSQPVLWMAC